MIQHLCRSSMNEFTKSVVSKNGWEISNFVISLSCLPGRPLHVNVRRFMPSSHLCSLRTHPNSKAIDIEYSLPMGIYEPDIARLADTFNAYLDDVVDNHLIKYAKLVLKIRDYDHSSQVFMVLCKWLHTWKRNASLSAPSMHARRLTPSS